MTYRFTGILFLLITSYLGVSQIVVDSSFRQIKITSQSKYYEDINDSIDIERIAKLDESNWVKVSPKGLNIAENRFGYWIKFNIECKKSGNYYLVNEFVSIDKYYIFIRNPNGIIKNIGFLDYDKSEIFNKLKYRFPTFKFKLKENIKYEIFLYGFNLRSHLMMPLSLMEENRFVEYISKDELLNGIIYGILLLLIISALVTAMFFKQKVYIYYVIHIFSILTFFIFGLGTGITYFWNGAQYLQNYGGHLSGVLSIVFFGYLTMEILQIKSLLKSYHRLFNYLVVFYISSTFFTLVLSAIISSYKVIVLYKLLNYSIILFPIFIIYICLYIFKTSKNMMALYILIIFQITIISYILFPLINFGVVPRSIFEFFKWLFPIESFLLWSILVRDLYSSKLKKIELQKEVISHKEESALNFIKGQDKERKRLSRQLHDSIGIKLASLKMNMISNEKIETACSHEVSKQIDEISTEVRHISHALNPDSLERQGLIKAIEEEIFRLEDLYQNLLFEFEHGSNIDIKEKGYQNMIYWTCMELLNNAIKYSKATEVKIKLKLEDNKICLSVQDNGIGYDPKKYINKGIGLRNIRDRAQLLNGTFTITRLQEGILHEFELTII